MKKSLIVLALMIVGFVSYGQPGYTRINSKYNWLTGAFDYLTIPAGDAPVLGTNQWVRAGAVYIDTSGGGQGVYYYRGGNFIRLYDTTNDIETDTSLLVQANNGLSRDGGYFQLGQDVSASGNPALISEDREIPVDSLRTITIKQNGAQKGIIFDARGRISIGGRTSSGGGKIDLLVDTTDGNSFAALTIHRAKIGDVLGSSIQLTGYGVHWTPEDKHVYITDMRNEITHAAIEVNGQSIANFHNSGVITLGSPTASRKVRIGSFRTDGIGQRFRVDGSSRFTDSVYINNAPLTTSLASQYVMLLGEDSVVRKIHPDSLHGGGGGMTNPMTTTGDLIYSSDGSGTPARLGIGSEGQLLISNGDGEPEWVDVSTAVPRGIDNVLSVAQSLTATRTINANSNILNITNTIGFQVTNTQDGYLNIQNGSFDTQIENSDGTISEQIQGNLTRLRLRHTQSSGTSEILISDDITINADDSTYIQNLPLLSDSTGYEVIVKNRASDALAKIPADLLAGGGGGANTTLSNLSTTAINSSLIPASTLTLGTNTDEWDDAYVNNYRSPGTMRFYINTTQIASFGTTALTMLRTLVPRTGSTTAGTAPIKFASSSLMTTAEAGAMEYNGDFYLTKASNVRMGVGGTLVNNVTSVSTSGSSEVDLQTYSMPAATLDNDGDFIEVRAYFTVNNAGQTIKILFGATEVVSFTTTTTGGHYVEGTVTRTGAATQLGIFAVTAGSATVTYKTTPAATLSGAVTIKGTGDAATLGVLSQDLLNVQYRPTN